MSGADLYHVYGNVTDFKNYQGNPMPKWDDLPPKIQEAWNAVWEHKIAPPLLDGRETRQVKHAIAYAHEFQDAGVPGHGQFMLIAKLAKALGFTS